MAALTAEFGTVSGDPRLRGRAHGGRSPQSMVSYHGCPGPCRAALAAAWRANAIQTSDGCTGNSRCGCEELGRSAPLASAGRPACSCGLSTGCSTRALTGKGTHLGDGFPLRCLQRLSVPHVAMRRCRWSTTAPPEVRPPRSSRTRGGSPQFPCARGG